MHDKITIVIATYNRTEFLTETIDSLLNQSYLPVEIIIVNDGSEERYNEDLESIVRISSLIKRIDLGKNFGVSHARNIGTKHANGDYILYLDDDDTLHQDMLEKCIQTFNKYPKVDVVMTGGEILNKNLNRLSHREKHVSLNTNRHLNLLHKESNSTLYFILFGMGLIHSFLFKKKVLLKYPFDEKLKIGEDTYQWLLLKSKGVNFRKIELCGAYYRLHANQISNKESNDNSKKDYLIKALQIINGDFEKQIFEIMNNSLLADAGISAQKNSCQLFIQSPFTFIYLKIFMLENKVERNILFLSNLLKSAIKSSPNK